MNISDETSDYEQAFAKAIDSNSLQALQRQAGLADQYMADLRQHVVPLASALVQRMRAATRPVLLGLNGCQGSGKSTLARFLAAMLQTGANLRCAIVSIDDFYLQKAARRRLARDVHPLLITRGPPGTHDVALANATLDTLLDPSRKESVHMPVFDKATDERAPRASWPALPPGIDVVLLEGWCVGCPPQDASALRQAVNALERDEDKNGIWREFVNEALAGEYRTLFARLDCMVMLNAPAFDSVYEWRRKQELQLAQSLRYRDIATATDSALLTGQSLSRFISHYERLTRHQLDVLPASADGVITLDQDHRMTGHSGRLFS